MEETAMAWLRHLAISVSDLPRAQAFFAAAFGMDKVGGNDRAVYVSDGTVNVALLGIGGRPRGWDADEPFYGIHHYGLWVEDVAETGRRIEAAGGTWVSGEEDMAEGAFYEVKYRDPMGVVFDITANGWLGATRDVVAAEARAADCRLRHVAFSVADAEDAKRFFVDAFGMTHVGQSKQAMYVSDGALNIAFIARDGQPLGWEKDEKFFGIDHFGIWVDDIAAARARVEAAEASYVMGNESGDPNSFYEIKYRDPLGHLFDLTANGWKGAVKEVRPTSIAAAAE
jgi:methylmalonyl-CoA/ethylmalonyl-CoA epimerase